MNKISVVSLILEDIKCNTHVKSKFILSFYRLAFASRASNSKLIRVATIPFRLAYRIVVDWIMGVDIPTKVQVGRRLVLYHSMALVINESVVIGDDCVLRHSVTIGNKMTENGESRPPIIGNRVEIGAGAVILGDVTIGDDSKIGAGTIITKSVKPNSIMVGNPGRDIRIRS